MCTQTLPTYINNEVHSKTKNLGIWQGARAFHV